MNARGWFVLRLKFKARAGLQLLLPFAVLFWNHPRVVCWTPPIFVSDPMVAEYCVIDPAGALIACWSTTVAMALRSHNEQHRPVAAVCVRERNPVVRIERCCCVPGKRVMDDDSIPKLPSDQRLTTGFSSAAALLRSHWCGFGCA